MFSDPNQVGSIVCALGFAVSTALIIALITIGAVKGFFDQPMKGDAIYASISTNLTFLIVQGVIALVVFNGGTDPRYDDVEMGVDTYAGGLGWFIGLVTVACIITSLISLCSKSPGAVTSSFTDPQASAETKTAGQSEQFETVADSNDPFMSAINSIRAMGQETNAETIEEQLLKTLPDMSASHELASHISEQLVEEARLQGTLLSVANDTDAPLGDVTERGQTLRAEVLNSVDEVARKCARFLRLNSDHPDAESLLRARMEQLAGITQAMKILRQDLAGYTFGAPSSGRTLQDLERHFTALSKTLEELEKMA